VAGPAATPVEAKVHFLHFHVWNRMVRSKQHLPWSTQEGLQVVLLVPEFVPLAAGLQVVSVHATLA